MRKLLLIAAAMVMVLFVSCGNKTTTSDENVSVETSIEVEGDTVTGGDDDPVSFNEIRFGKWDDKDWWDNEYISTVRTYVDKFHAGEIEDKVLDKYKNGTKSKFVVGSVQPFWGGGLFITVIFLDLPENVFSFWVYSGINDNDEVDGYFVRIVVEEDYILEGNTKEELLKTIEEHPYGKLW